MTTFFTQNGYLCPLVSHNMTYAHLFHTKWLLMRTCFTQNGYLFPHVSHKMATYAHLFHTKWLSMPTCFTQNGSLCPFDSHKMATYAHLFHTKWLLIPTRFTQNGYLCPLVSHKMATCAHLFHTKWLLMPTNVYVTFPVVDYRILQNVSTSKAIFIQLYFFRRYLIPVRTVDDVYSTLPNVLIELVVITALSHCVSVLMGILRGADKSLARPGTKQARKHVRDARDFNKIEARAVINSASLQGKAPEGNSRHSDRNISLFPS